MRRVAVLGIAAVLVVAFAVLWVVPVLAGPRIDCGPFDEVTCDLYVADVIARHDHPTAPEHARRPGFLPVLIVELWGSEGCYAYRVVWLFGGIVSEPLC